jgi:hypothetical protein
VEEVSLEIMGKMVHCPSCGHAFLARALKQMTQARRHKNPMSALLWVLVIGLLITAVLIVQTFFRSSEPPAVPADGPIEEVEEVPVEEAPEPDSKATAAKDVPSSRGAFCLDFLGALADGDAESAMNMLNFPALYRNRRAPSEPRWTDLSELDQVMKKQEYLQAMAAPLSEGNRFVTLLEDAEVRELGRDAKNGTGTYAIKVQDPIERKTYEIELTLMERGKAILVSGYSLEISKPVKAVDPDAPKTLDEKYKRRISPEGEISRVAYVEGTSPAEIRELSALIERLFTGSRAERREIREKLMRYNRKAVPALLNKLVELDMTKDADVGRANTVLGILRGMTKEHFGFTPGYQVDDVYDDPVEELRRSLRRWFGWWEKNKQTWTGPPKAPEATEDW